MSSTQGCSSPPTPTEGPEDQYVEDQLSQQGDWTEQPQECPDEPESEPSPELQPQQELDPEQESESPQQLGSLQKLNPQQEPDPQQDPNPQQDPGSPQDVNSQQELDPQQELESVESSDSNVSDQPPEAPPKDRNLASGTPGPSHTLSWSSTAQSSFTAAAQLISHQANQPTDPRTSGTRSAGPTSNRNTTTGRHNTWTATATNTDPVLIRPIPIPIRNSSTPNPNRAQVHFPPSRELSYADRRSTGSVLVAHDPIRGDNSFQPPHFPDSNGYEGGGDPSSALNRNASRRSSVPVPRSMVDLADGTVVGNGSGTLAGSRRASRLMSGQDWLVGVPVVDQPPRLKTLEERLKPTMNSAIEERDKYKKRSSQQNWIINGAIGVQIIVGALTTGVAASGSRHIGTGVAALGGISTILASYLAKVRGSGEPEFSTIRTRELNSFLREAETFVMDHGDETGTEYDEQLMAFRERFEAIIKTDGEDSGAGLASHLHHASPTHPPPHAASPCPHFESGHKCVMPGAYNPSSSSEKKEQSRKDGKTVNAMV